MPTFISHLDLRVTLPPRKDILITHASLLHPVPVSTEPALHTTLISRSPSPTSFSSLVFLLVLCAIAFMRFLAPIPTSEGTSFPVPSSPGFGVNLLLYPHPALPGMGQSWGWCSVRALPFSPPLPRDPAPLGPLCRAFLRFLTSGLSLALWYRSLELLQDCGSPQGPHFSSTPPGDTQRV